jgi:hypothetical protein
MLRTRKQGFEQVENCLQILEMLGILTPDQLQAKQVADKLPQNFDQKDNSQIGFVC